MKRIILSIIIIGAVFALMSCGNGNGDLVYQGMLDARTTVVSARTAGEIKELYFDTGDSVDSDALLAKIDSETQEIQKRQQQARFDEIESQKAAALLQINQAQVQLNLNKDTLAKTEKLLQEGGATQQSRDELATQVEVGQSNLEILQSNYKLILAKEQEVQAGIDLSDLQIRNTSIHAPAAGVVLNRYHSEGELVGSGTPLFELAALDKLELYIYVPLSELPKFHIGDEVSIQVDGLDSPRKGTLEWVADKGEFTPKTILTKDTRETLVYEVRILVDNGDGALKIGMPVDVRI